LDLTRALQEVLQRASLYTNHYVEPEKLSIRERMTSILNRINSHSFTEFTHFFSATEGNMGVTVTFIAMLELIKQAVIELVQAKPFAPIYVKAKE
jgi:segregation and condensation protein A